MGGAGAKMEPAAVSRGAQPEVPREVELHEHLCRAELHRVDHRSDQAAAALCFRPMAPTPAANNQHYTQVHILLTACRVAPQTNINMILRFSQNSIFPILSPLPTLGILR